MNKKIKEIKKGKRNYKFCNTCHIALFPIYLPLTKDLNLDFSKLESPKDGMW